MATSNVQVNEGQVSFKRMQGHKHDGITSSLIDTSQYSMFDFAATENSTDRAAKQSNNKKMLKTFIVSTIEERVLNPQGIRLQANAITAREIVAGTITANELSANIVLVNNVIRSTNYVSNSTTKTGWLISSNGNAEFNDVTIRGNLISGDGFYAASNTKIFANSNGYFSLGSNFAWNGTSLSINGNITLSNTNVGTFDNGDSLTAGNIGGITIGPSSIRSNGYDANPTTAGFLINSDGTATFNEVTVRGTINANAGVFLGFLAAGNTQVGTNINGAAGYGGIRVGNRGWENAWVERNDGSIYFNAQNLSGSNRIYMDNTDALISFGNGAFSVSNNGALTATSGSIGGSVTIGGTAASTVVTNATNAVQPSGVQNNLGGAGVTTITGGKISTGIISSVGGTRTINLDTGAINFGNFTVAANGSAVFAGTVTASGGSVGAYTINSSLSSTYNESIPFDYRVNRYVLSLESTAKLSATMAYQYDTGTGTSTYTGRVLINQGAAIDGASIIVDSSGGSNTYITAGIIDTNVSIKSVNIYGTIRATTATGNSTPIHQASSGAPLTRMSSKRALKYDIKDFNEIGLIDKLVTRTFKWKRPEGITETEYQKYLRENTIDIGFIAEEVAEIENGRLANFEDDERKTPSFWKYIDIIALLVAEVKDLRKRVASLEDDV